MRALLTAAIHRRVKSIKYNTWTYIVIQRVISTTCYDEEIMPLFNKWDWNCASVEVRDEAVSSLYLTNLKTHFLWYFVLLRLTSLSRIVSLSISVLQNIYPVEERSESFNGSFQCPVQCWAVYSTQQGQKHYNDRVIDVTINGYKYKIIANVYSSTVIVCWSRR